MMTGLNMYEILGSKMEEEAKKLNISEYKGPYTSFEDEWLMKYIRDFKNVDEQLLLQNGYKKTAEGLFEKQAEDDSYVYKIIVDNGNRVMKVYAKEKMHNENKVVDLINVTYEITKVITDATRTVVNEYDDLRVSTPYEKRDVIIYTKDPQEILREILYLIKAFQLSSDIDTRRKLYGEIAEKIGLILHTLYLNMENN